MTKTRPHEIVDRVDRAPNVFLTPQAKRTVGHLIRQRFLYLEAWAEAWPENEDLVADALNDAAYLRAIYQAEFTDGQ